MSANGIIIPGNTSTALLGEMRSKQLANKFLDVAEGYDNLEILAALAICAGCTIRARYPKRERDQALTVTINIMQNCMNQP